jgi:hypothetical protein
MAVYTAYCALLISRKYTDTVSAYGTGLEYGRMDATLSSDINP